MRFQAARAVADAVLLEGYSLYPYRPSAIKNRMRWQFGVLEAGAGSPGLDSEVLLELPATSGQQVATAPQLECRLRFLRLVRRQLQVAIPRGTEGAESADSAEGTSFSSVNELELDGQLLLSWDEGETIELPVILAVDQDVSSAEWRFTRPPGESCDLLRDRDGRVVGRWRRTACAVTARLRLDVAPAVPGRAVRLRWRVDNESVSPAAAAEETEAGDERQRALAISLLGTHVLLGTDGPGFVSLLEPPEWAGAAAAACKSTRCFPVLAGPPGRRDLVLISPILLYDHPAVAPESPGDFFDASEIDELLSLRTLTLTDEEKRQARASDPRVAALLDRVHSLSHEQLARLHGTLRERRELAPTATTGPGALDRRASAPDDIDDVDDPAVPESVMVQGLRVSKGSRVVLRPGPRRTDAQDMFLDGQDAIVEEIKRDVDGTLCLAVTLENDPAAELHRWKGRYHYFRLDEVEAPMQGASPASEWAEIPVTVEQERGL
jgi:hypothetical protein